MDSNAIQFYSTSGEHGYLSNFARFPIALEGKRWPTSEHYFQAQKFLKQEYREQIRSAPTPARAAELGRSRKLPLRRDWESVKVDVMRVALLAKFTQHADLRDRLLATGEARLVEHTENDAYWGDGGDGSGKNMLGRLLVEVREQLRSARGR